MTRYIGIDLGTTNSCASVVEDGHPKVIPFAKGYLTIPSVVAFTKEDELLVGPDAMRQAPTNPENTIYGSKRLLGRPYSSYVVQTVKRLFHYEIVEGKNGEVEVIGNDRHFTVPEIAALILRAIKDSAIEYLGDSDLHAVITVPAYFTDRQRSAVRMAGEMAGLDVVRIINEPTAAALAYGHRKSKDKKVVIYDLGGGTFDVSVLDIKGDEYKVLSTDGDTFLGGVDFDNRMVERLVNQFLRDTGVDLIGDRVALQRIKAAAEECKKELSLRQEGTVHIPYIATGPDGPLDMDYTINRAGFESAVVNLVDRTIETCKDALDQAELDTIDIDEVVLVGGQTRMPLIWKKIDEYFGKSPSKGVHPDEVVAMGAAILADMISRDESKVKLVDVVPLSIGLRLPGNRFKRIIQRNSHIPIEKTESFTTSKDDQKNVKITVLQGESEQADENEMLAKVIVSDLPPHKKGELEIEVKFSVDVDGILTVTAKDQTTGKEVTTTVTNRGGHKS
jgi:molecular chaperone DnaK